MGGQVQNEVQVWLVMSPRYFGGPGGMCRKLEVKELMNESLSDEVRSWWTKKRKLWGNA